MTDHQDTPEKSPAAWEMTFLDRWVDKGGRWFSFLFLISGIVIVYEVFARYVFGAPTIWGHETTTLLCALFLRHFRALVEAGHVYAAMPPLYRVDVGKQVFYALDDAERQGVMDRIAAEDIKGRVNVQRFKGLGEMNPIQLRETTIDPDTRRLVQLTVEPGDDSQQTLDLLLAKSRAADRRGWLEKNGNLADI